MFTHAELIRHPCPTLALGELRRITVEYVKSSRLACCNSTTPDLPTFGKKTAFKHGGLCDMWLVKPTHDLVNTPKSGRLCHFRSKTTALFQLFHDKVPQDLL